MATQKTITPAKRKLIDNSVAIFGDAATSKESAYMARELVQCTLPHKNPGDIPAWSRRNGNLILTIRPGWNSNKQEVYGYPYGTIPRLILFWIVTEAIRTRSPELELGTSISGFMEELGLSSYTGRGKRGDAVRLKEQMERLFNSFISFEGNIERDGRVGTARINMAVASESMLWWNPKTPEQLSWGSRVKLGKEFYDAITAAPVPVDMRALKALKKSPLL
ncbi:replication protein RepA [Methylomagnum ishizawai]|uniref:replication protein RepA n=1 Tax=Methylomagnum ishizawai TaxID=1760988 RepID=UPI000F745FA0|nr:replication protein RepA [Methylomagnum ishizawai]